MLFGSEYVSEEYRYVQKRRKEKRRQGGRMFLEREEESGDCELAWKKRKRKNKMKGIKTWFY